MSQLDTWLCSGTPERPHIYVDATFWNYPGSTEVAKRIFTGYPVVVIKRNRNECIASWEKWTGEYMSVSHRIDTMMKYDDMLRQIPHMSIDYKNLDSYWYVDSAVNFLTNGKHISPEAFALINNMKIELHKEKVWKILKELEARINSRKQ